MLTCPLCGPLAGSAALCGDLEGDLTVPGIQGVDVGDEPRPATCPHRALGRLARRRPALILDLPPEIVHKIFGELTFRSVCAFSATCKLLGHLEAQVQDALWSRLARARWDSHDLRRFDQPRHNAVGIASWKQRYLCLYADISRSTAQCMCHWVRKAFDLTLELVRLKTAFQK